MFRLAHEIYKAEMAAAVENLPTGNRRANFFQDNEIESLTADYLLTHTYIDKSHISR